MATPPDYTAWPTGEDVIRYLTMYGLEPSTMIEGDPTLEAIVGASNRMITQQTKREFIESTSELRRFDGSGVAEQEIDDYTNVTKVEVKQWGAVSGLDITEYVEQERKHYPKTRIYLRQGVRPSWGNYFLDRFPEGYANVEVTATWGYGSTIPEDIWLAVCLKSCSLVADAVGLEKQGRVLNYKEGDVSETYYPRPPSAAAGWDQFIQTAIDLHRRPLARHVRKWRPKIL